MVFFLRILIGIVGAAMPVADRAIGERSGR